jgi:hypothetical protein
MSWATSPTARPTPATRCGPGPGGWTEEWIDPAELAAAWRFRPDQPHARAGAFAYYVSETPHGPVALLTERVRAGERMVRAVCLDSSLTALTPRYQGPSSVATDVIDRASAAVVRISGRDTSGHVDWNNGSGAIISPDGLIMTANHVAPEPG